MITIKVDNRARFERPEASIEAELKKAFEDDNPQFALNRKLGYPTYGIDRTIRSWRIEGKDFTVPRGGVRHVRAIFGAHGIPYHVQDARHPGDPCDDFPKSRPHIVMRWYQEEAIAAALEKQNCIIRASTGSGKTSMAFALAARIGLNCLVMLPTKALLSQWQKRALKELEIDNPEEVGLIQGKTRRLRPLTLCMQRTLAAKGVDEEIREFFGVIICDEVQLFGAKTFYQVIDPFPAKFRVGISADERRKDRKEFLIHHQFGDVAHEATRDVLEKQGYVVDVEIRVLPTDFAADWYGLSDNPNDEREIDFTRLVNEMVVDEDRNDLILEHALAELHAGEQVIMLSHRIEHCQVLNRALIGKRIKTGFLIGGDYEKEFEETSAGILDGSYRAGIGTYLALGFGVDLPAVSVGIATTPIAANRQNFNQVRGRLSRPSKGKQLGRLYYPWDRKVYPGHLRNIVAWNPSVKVLDRGKWVDGRHYLNQRKRRG